MKAQITICWSNTVEIEIPDGTTLDDLEDYRAPENIREIADKIRDEAYSNISAAHGVITDVQESDES